MYQQYVEHLVRVLAVNIIIQLKRYI